MPYAETNGIETYYEQRGEGEPLVFIHGLDGHHGEWEHQSADLVDEYQVIVYDIRGSGFTGATDEWPYSIRLFADDLHALVTELELDDPTVVGHSMGAKVAIDYATRYPDSLSNLVFASTSHPDEDVGLLPAVLFKGLLVPFNTSLIGLFGWKTREVVDEWVSERVFGEEGTSDDEHDPTDEHDAPDEMTAHEYWKRNMASFNGEPDELDVSNATVPTLVCYGEHDTGMIVDSAPRVADDVNAPAEVVEVPDAGHNLPQDTPDVFNRILREFLNGSLDKRGEVVTK